MSATNTTNVNIPQMADTLFERATNASWVVVFKALVTTHHMCVHGNEVSECHTAWAHVEQWICSTYISHNKMNGKESAIQMNGLSPFLIV